MTLLWTETSPFVDAKSILGEYSTRLTIPDPCAAVLQKLPESFICRASEFNFLALGEVKDEDRIKSCYESAVRFRRSPFPAAQISCFSLAQRYPRCDAQLGFMQANGLINRYANLTTLFRRGIKLDQPHATNPKTCI
jgi:hypothetical protein